MNIEPIKTKQDYQKAIKRLEDIFDAAPNTAEGDELEVLGILIDNFEKNHFPVDLPDPIEAIKFRMEQLDYSNQDLAKIIGFGFGNAPALDLCLYPKVNLAISENLSGDKSGFVQFRKHAVVE